jgi:hypothetical protein
MLMESFQQMARYRLWRPARQASACLVVVTSFQVNSMPRRFHGLKVTMVGAWISRAMVVAGMRRSMRSVLWPVKKRAVCSVALTLRQAPRQHCRPTNRQSCRLIAVALAQGPGASRLRAKVLSLSS